MKFPYVLKVSLWIWLIAAIVLGMLLTSCNPYEDGVAAPTVTAVTAALSPTQPIPITPTANSPPRVCTVLTGIPDGALNLRTGAGIEHAVITTLTEGQRLTLTAAAPRGVWIQVSTADQITGWINSNYCTSGES